MADFVIMPKQGQSVESCVITEWHKKIGDKIKKGDILFSYETDKAFFEEDAKIEGTLLAILSEEGDDAPCLSNVCIIGKENEDISELIGDTGNKETRMHSDKTDNPLRSSFSEQYSPAIKTQNFFKGADLFISPRAKTLANKENIDISLATPTGPYGRIIERDLIRLLEKGAEFIKKSDNKILSISDSDKKPEPDYIEKPLSNLRKTISKTMAISLSEMAQLTNHSHFNASKILEFRKLAKSRKDRPGFEDITINSMILFAVSRVIKNHSALNAHFINDKIRLFNTVNLGIAVDTERGLLVPTIYNADKKSLIEISQECSSLIKAAQSGNISPDSLTNATFTVTNLGSLGVESFTPIINPPQTAILGVCSIIPYFTVSDEKNTYYPAMGLSLTYDHRIIDGAPAARFVKELMSALEDFDLFLLI